MKSVGTVSGTTTVPTVTDNLFAQKTIPEESIAISFNPITESGQVNGEMTFGSTDASKSVNVLSNTYYCMAHRLNRFTGDITFTPITKTSPASQYWGIDQTITYGSSGSALLTSSGIVDTGTTLLLIATDAFKAYEKATGAKMDQLVIGIIIVECSNVCLLLGLLVF